jgi:Tfp pilus assembly protein PilF
MTVATGPEDRDVIPRWRSLGATVASGELGQQVADAELDEQGEDELERSWRAWEADPSLISTAELVSAGLVLGVPGRVEEAARSLRRESLPAGVQHLVEAVLSRAHPSEQDPPSVQSGPPTSDPRRRARRLKAALAQDPRRAIAWLELGRIYAALGQSDSARGAIRAAVALAPDDRFVLRSASCFFVNAKEADRAHRLLANAQVTAADPWLMAAELATAQAADARPRYLKRAKQLLESGDFRERDVSELASEVGTFELRSGADRRARRLFARATGDPTENALAQVEWASRRSSGLELSTTNLSLPSAYEARAQHWLEAGKWRPGAEAAQLWLEDQPFSTVAAMVASYGVLTGLQDYSLGLTLAEHGLRIDANDPVLLNNAAYASVELSDYARAAAYLKRAANSTVTGGDRVALLATAGMLAYRLGDLEEGRDGYRTAIRSARASRDVAREAMAATMMAREEKLIGGEMAEELRRQAEKLAQGTTSAAVQLWLSFLQDD